MARAVIVGCGGQDGRLLWDQLLARGYSLVGIGRESARAHESEWSEQVRINDFPSVLRLVDKFRPDEIYYLAAYHHGSQDQTPADDVVWAESVNVNVQGFLNFLQAVQQRHRSARIFYASSSRIFGTSAISPQSEKTPIRPDCLYGISKATAMMLARRYRESHGLWISCGILYNHESPLRGSNFITQKVVRTLAAIRRGARTRLQVGRLEDRVDWGYAPDYTRAMQLMLGADRPDDFVVATGKMHSVRELIEVALKCLDLEWGDLIEERAGLLQRPSLPLCGDASHLRAMTGWQPSVEFAQMVEYLVRAAERGQVAREI